jgi:hypothetical protein
MYKQSMKKNRKLFKYAVSKEYYQKISRHFAAGGHQSGVESVQKLLS